MAASIQAKTTPVFTNTATSTTLTVNVPTGTTDGDLLIAHLGTDSSTIGAPAGWTLIRTASTTNAYTRTYYRIASSEPASYNFTTNAVGATFGGAMLRISGHNSTTPIDVHTGNAGTGNSVTAPAATGTQEDLLRLRFGCKQNELISGDEYGTLSNTISIAGASDGATSSTIASYTFTGTTSSEDWAAQTIAIAPAAADEPQAAIMMGANF